MATNYDKSGNIWNGPAPEDVVSGQAVAFGEVGVGIAQVDALEGENAAFSLAGVWEVPYTGTPVTVGQPMNFIAATGEFTVDDVVATGDLIGVGMSFSPSADDLIQVKINTHLAEFVPAP